MYRAPLSACLAHLLFAACCFLTVNAPAASAQSYGLRSSDWTGAHTNNSWFDCRNWDNAAPDRYTAARVDGTSRITDNGSHKAQAANLTIDTSTGGLLTIAPGGELEITAETNTPANTRRYDERTWLTSHNAHTAYEYNVIYAQQSNDLGDQLDDGARALMIDVYDWEGVNDQDLYLCHNDCGIPFINPNTLSEGSAVGVLATVAAVLAAGGLLGGAPFAAGILGAYVLADELARMKLSDGLDEIADFLESNTGAIVTLIIEDDADAADINSRLADAGLTGYMYDPAVDHPEGKTGCWPSTAWMVANGKRLVVFIQHGPADLDGRLLGQFAYTVENTFDIGVAESNYDPTCEARGESQPLNNRSRKLFVMNHFASFTLPTEFNVFSDFDSPLDGIDFDGSGSPNFDDLVLDRVDGECLTAANRYPNFIALDFFDHPGNNGPADVVAELNGRWTPDGFGYNAVPWYTSSTVVSSARSEAIATAQAGAAATGTAAGAPGPGAYGLEPNYPNPFASRTTIRYTLPEEARVRLTVYDLMGREVEVLADGVYAGGRYDVAFDGSDLPAGLYLYRLEAGRYVEHRKMLLVK